ncbi:Armadillo-type fold domain-containing protein [Strongyloides ratti]|uniref:Armadillo-type fold domain-containing protein n=1 Tax=Strongyloides ratti TaxID=34506 RepID=A0A090L3Y5_STRRB|nr:Armadillo-type fold domain-containing protein [Strongyloides ratti]CEF64432.1 Armadillo-type fold domain-containing protein [Strongyloides ratti]
MALVKGTKIRLDDDRSIGRRSVYSTYTSCTNASINSGITSYNDLDEEVQMEMASITNAYTEIIKEKKGNIIPASYFYLHLNSLDMLSTENTIHFRASLTLLLVLLRQLNSTTIIRNFDKMNGCLIRYMENNQVIQSKPLSRLVIDCLIKIYSVQSPNFWGDRSTHVYISKILSFSVLSDVKMSKCTGVCLQDLIRNICSSKKAASEKLLTEIFSFALAVIEKVSESRSPEALMSLEKIYNDLYKFAPSGCVASIVGSLTNIISGENEAVEKYALWMLESIFISELKVEEFEEKSLEQLVAYLTSKSLNIMSRDLRLTFAKTIHRITKTSVKLFPNLGKGSLICGTFKTFWKMGLQIDGYTIQSLTGYATDLAQIFKGNIKEIDNLLGEIFIPLQSGQINESDVSVAFWKAAVIGFNSYLSHSKVFIDACQTMLIHASQENTVIAEKSQDLLFTSIEHAGFNVLAKHLELYIDLQYEGQPLHLKNAYLLKAYCTSKVPASIQLFIDLFLGQMKSIYDRASESSNQHAKTYFKLLHHIIELLEHIVNNPTDFSTTWSTVVQMIVEGCTTMIEMKKAFLRVLKSGIGYVKANINNEEIVEAFKKTTGLFLPILLHAYTTKSVNTSTNTIENLSKDFVLDIMMECTAFLSPRAANGIFNTIVKRYDEITEDFTEANIYINLLRFIVTFGDPKLIEDVFNFCKLVYTGKRGCGDKVHVMRVFGKIYEKYSDPAFNDFFNNVAWTPEQLISDTNFMNLEDKQTVCRNYILVKIIATQPDYSSVYKMFYLCRIPLLKSLAKRNNKRFKERASNDLKEIFLFLSKMAKNNNIELNKCMDDYISVLLEAINDSYHIVEEYQANDLREGAYIELVNFLTNHYQYVCSELWERLVNFINTTVVFEVDTSSIICLQMKVLKYLVKSIPETLYMDNRAKLLELLPRYTKSMESNTIKAHARMLISEYLNICEEDAILEAINNKTLTTFVHNVVKDKKRKQGKSICGDDDSEGSIRSKMTVMTNRTAKSNRMKVDSDEDDVDDLLSVFGGNNNTVNSKTVRESGYCIRENENTDILDLLDGEKVAENIIVPPKKKQNIKKVEEEDNLMFSKDKEGRLVIKDLELENKRKSGSKRQAEDTEMKSASDDEEEEENNLTVSKKKARRMINASKRMK